MTKQARNQAIYNCHKEGMFQVKIGKIFNLRQSTVSQIINAVKRGSVGIKKETRGAKSKLTNKQKEELKELLLNPPSDYGYFTWNKWSIKALIKKEFKVDYHENYIFKIMKCIKYSSQRPQEKDYRQNEEKVKVFKEETIPSIKKKQLKKIG